MAKNTEILLQIKQSIIAIDDSAEVILFGSRARGDNTKESDWDILVLSNKEVNATFKHKISDSLFYIGLDNIATISTIVVNKQNWYNKFKGYPLFFEIQKDGIAI